MNLANLVTLSDSEKAMLAELLAKNAGSKIEDVVRLAYQSGILVGMSRANNTVSSSSADTNDDDDDTSPLSAADMAALTRLGVNPGQSFRQRNSVFTITGYKPSRWKYPISVKTQAGTRYKMTVDQVVALQKSSK